MALTRIWFEPLGRQYRGRVDLRGRKPWAVACLNSHGLELKLTLFRGHLLVVTEEVREMGQLHSSRTTMNKYEKTSQVAVLNCQRGAATWAGYYRLKVHEIRHD